MPTLDVRPLSISCLCRNRLTRARPLPSSRAPRHDDQGFGHFTKRLAIPLVRTPRVVDFPLSTFPTTAQRTSGVKDTSVGGSRNKSVARGWIDLVLNSTVVFPCRSTLYMLNIVTKVPCRQLHLLPGRFLVAKHPALPQYVLLHATHRSLSQVLP